MIGQLTSLGGLFIFLFLLFAHEAPAPRDLLHNRGHFGQGVLPEDLLALFLPEDDVGAGTLFRRDSFIAAVLDLLHVFVELLLSDVAGPRVLVS